MYHLIYTSYAIDPFDETRLIELLKVARENNRLLNITGMLLYVNGKFMQVLEGNRQTVKDLYTHITNDPRHKRVTTLLEGDSATRMFDRWSMGFKKLSDDDFKNLSGFEDADEFFLKQHLTEDSSLVMVFLQLFYKKNFVDFPEPTLT
ncbi:MAG: BLUF domain-containing protein [Flammeovirgaceae bacterium]